MRNVVDHSKLAASRMCARCRRPLSRYNEGDYCGGCAKAVAGTLADTSGALPGEPAPGLAVKRSEVHVKPAAGTRPGEPAVAVPIADGKTTKRQEKQNLREQMRADGKSHREICAEFARVYRLRPRMAWRESYGWSLVEAARRINAYRGVHGMDQAGYSSMTGAHLCEYENWPGFAGDKPTGRKPSLRLLAVLAAVYGCEVTELIDTADRVHLSPADLLILDRSMPHVPEYRSQSYDSNQVVEATLSLPAASLDASLDPVGPEFGDSEYLLSVRSHIRKIVALDNRFGAGDLVRLSTRFFRALHDQLGAGAYDPRLERDLQSAAGELAEVVGWLAYDSEAHDLARRMNQEALYFARLAGDRVIELLTLQNSSMHAASQGHPREALQIARSVLEGDYRLSPRVKALFLTRKARALAQVGDESALRLLPEIRSLFLDGVSDGDPAWAWWVDERELAWHEAMTQRDLGLVGQAITQFERSVIATPATEIRSQYLHRAFLLQAQVDNSTWDDAEQTIRQLLPLAAEVASTRTVVLLRNTLCQLATHDKVPSSLQEQAAMLAGLGTEVVWGQYPHICVMPISRRRLL